MKKTYTKKQIKQIVLAVCLICLFIFSLFSLYAPKLDLPKEHEFYGAQLQRPSAEIPCCIYFLDVGEADCSLILTEDATIMIDTGDTNAFPTIELYLSRLHVQTIDYLILTHAHADHIGSASDVLKKYHVSNVIMPRYTQEQMPTSKLYENLLLTLQETKPKIIAAKAGSEYNLGALSFSIVAPNRTYKEMNNSSVVTLFKFGNKSFLFQGDAEKKSEKDILQAGFNVSADVIKLGHHGSKTSSIEPYIQAVAPSFAVISCGYNNTYNFPDSTVLDRLNAHHVEYRRTDLHGTISMYTDGEKLYYETEKEP